MRKKKILVTGAFGQLGLKIRDNAPDFDDLVFIFTDVDKLDITDFRQLQSWFENYPVDFVVNCAAYTAVDKAETDKESAFRINADACEHLAKLSSETGFKLVHISTDFVFDGKQDHPYVEDDNPHPLSVYGESKLAGEKLIQSLCDDYLIVRTSWLYSEYGHNFVKTMIRYGGERKELHVVNDQTGSPTYAGDLALAILRIISGYPSAKGIYHYTNEGAISWYDFAQAIMEISGIECHVNAIPTVQYPTPAKRPAYGVLDKTKIKETFGLEIPFWKDSLQICIKNLNHK